MTVPFEGQAETYRTIKGAIEPGTIVVDCTSPLATAVGGRAWHVVRPWHGSAAEQAKAILDPGVRMVGAFHTISGEALQDLEHEMESDVLVCGTDKEAKAIVGGVIEDIPRLRWVDAGDLTQARIAETLTALLISINRTYKIHDAGVRITGRDAWGIPGGERVGRVSQDLAYAIVSASSHPNPTAHTATRHRRGHLDELRPDRDHDRGERAPTTTIAFFRSSQLAGSEVDGGCMHRTRTSSNRPRSHVYARDPPRDEDAPERDQDAERPDVPRAPLGIDGPAPDAQEDADRPRRSPRRSTS